MKAQDEFKIDRAFVAISIMMDIDAANLFQVLTEV
jgi:hypothetical protein